MNKMPRDSQRGKLYRAERIAFPPGAGKSLPEMRDVEAYLKRVWASRWFRREFPIVASGSFLLRPGFGARAARGRFIAWGRVSRITLPRWARKSWVILHELAHCCNNQWGKPGIHHDNNSICAHGWGFAAIFLKLVGYFEGREAEKKLKAAFRQCRVRFRPKKILSPETLAQLRERGKLLAAARRKDVNPS